MNIKNHLLFLVLLCSFFQLQCSSKDQNEKSAQVSLKAADAKQNATKQLVDISFTHKRYSDDDHDDEYCIRFEPSTPIATVLRFVQETDPVQASGLQVRPDDLLVRERSAGPGKRGRDVPLTGSHLADLPIEEIVFTKSTLRVVTLAFSDQAHKKFAAGYQEMAKILGQQLKADVCRTLTQGGVVTSGHTKVYPHYKAGCFVIPTALSSVWSDKKFFPNNASNDPKKVAARINAALATPEARAEYQYGLCAKYMPAQQSGLSSSSSSSNSSSSSSSSAAAAAAAQPQAAVSYVPKLTINTDF